MKWPLLFPLLMEALPLGAQMTAQMIKTEQMLGMQPYTVTVQYTYYHYFFNGTNSQNQAQFTTQTGSASVTADILILPGDPLVHMGGFIPDQCVRYTVGGTFNVKVEGSPPCNQSLTVNNNDKPTLNFHYVSDKNWVATCEISKVDPGAMKCFATPYGSVAINQTNGSVQRSGKGFTANGSYFRDTTMGGHEDQLKGNMTITVQPSGPPQQWEALIIPLDKPGYEKWLPLGPPVDGSYNKGNTIGFTVKIRQKNDTNVLYQLPYGVSWSLETVTKNEGYCGNYPADNGSPDTKPDLRFDDSIYKNNPSVASVTEDALTSKENQGMAVAAIVTSFDYGSYGQLGAKVTLNDGSTIEAVNYRRTDRNVLPIPCDDNNNQVADYYEKNQNIYDKNYPADWDGEKIFDMVKGDGLTLYEEYRGFVLEDANGKHAFRRLSADTAEVFYHTLPGETADHISTFKQGAQLYATISGVNLIYINDATLLGKEGSGTYPIRKLNFNKCLSDKYPIDAIVLVPNTKNQETYTSPVGGEAMGSKSFGPYETDYISVFMDPDFQDAISWLPPVTPVNKTQYTFQFADTLLKNDANIDVQFATMGTYVSAHVADLRRKLLVFSICHEFGHATGMRHHMLDQYLQDADANDLEHQTAIDIGNYLSGVKDNTSNAIIGNALDALVAKVYKLAGYSPTSCWSYYGQGDEQCPMVYWCCPYHAVELLCFFSGNYDPTQNAPLLKQWQFCDTDKKQMHLHP